MTETDTLITNMMAHNRRDTTYPRPFVGTLFQDCEGEVELFIMMNDIARYIGDSRLIVSKLLNRLHEERSIRLGRGHFIIHDIKAFINKYNSPTSLIHHVI